MRVLLVDDSTAIRERVAEMISEVPGVEVVGQAADAEAGAEMVRRLVPDAVVLDIRLPQGNGVRLLEDLKESFPGMVVVMLTNYPYPQYRRRCLAAGADYFLEKGTEIQKLPEILGRLVSTNGGISAERGDGRRQLPPRLSSA